MFKLLFESNWMGEVVAHCKAGESSAKLMCAEWPWLTDFNFGFNSAVGSRIQQAAFGQGFFIDNGAKMFRV